MGRELISKAGISIRSAIRLSSAAGCAPRNRPSISSWSTICWAATVLVVVKDRLFSQAEMHLDTYFNIIDRNLVTLTARRMTTDPDSPDLLLADIYLRGANGVYTKTEEDVGFIELLRSRIGAAIIPISEEDADRLAGNFLTVGPRRIIGVAGQSEALRTELKHRGVKVTWVGLDNLCKGYGAAHCMTQVLRRR